jgi:hypothetical protein
VSSIRMNVFSWILQIALIGPFVSAVETL